MDSVSEPKRTPSTRKSTGTRSRIGRPTREESERRQEELLECALDIFLERGYDQTTMADIAAFAGMSKRTLYAKYEDKADLFRAAVRRAVERYTLPIEAMEAVATDDLESTLTAVARLRIANLATPAGIKLQRVLNTQSYRFPDLFNAAFEETTGPTIDFLAALFERHNALGVTRVPDPRRAAVAFLSLVIGAPARIITSGNPLPEPEIEARVKFSVQLFLNGIRPR